MKAKTRRTQCEKNLRDWFDLKKFKDRTISEPSQYHDNKKEIFLIYLINAVLGSLNK